MKFLRAFFFLITYFLLETFVSAQSAFVLKEGAAVSISSNTTLTINGDFLATSGTDTSRISTEGRIEITGDWENNSSGRVVDLSEGEIEFNGGSLQEIRGENSFYNLTINNAAGVNVMTGSVILHNELQPTLGDFNTGDVFTLRSTANKTARIAPIITGSVSGEVTIEAFIENQAYDFRFLSMPVQNNSLSYWSDDFIMSGFIGTPNPLFSFNSIFFYDETQTGDRNARYTNATSTANPVAMGAGVQAYLGASDILVDVTGEIYSGTINFPVTFTDDVTQDDDEDGWNLLGNPYPSTIDWTSPSWTRVNVNDAIYIYEGSTGMYQSYINGAGTNGGTQFIPSSQAFWVKATGTPTLTATENVKTATEAGFIEHQVQELLRLSLSNSQGADEIVIRYNKEASSLFDGNWDAYKLKGTSVLPILSAVQKNEEYSILSSSIDSLYLPIYLKAEVPSSGTYQLNVSELPPNINCIFLEDLFTGRIESLRDSAAFTFHLSDTTTIARFKLIVSKLTDYSYFPTSCYGDSAYINLTSIIASPVNFTRYSSPNFLPQTDSNLIAKRYSLADGTHYIDVNLSGCLTQRDTFIVSSPTALVGQLNSTPDTGFASGSAWVNLSGGTSPYKVFWDSRPNVNTDSITDVPSGYQAVKVIDANGCELRDSVFVKGIITSIEKSDLSELSIFPNPVHNTININGLLETNIEFKLLDALGRVVKWGTLKQNNTSIDVRELKSGLYFLQLTDNLLTTEVIKIKKI